MSRTAQQNKTLWKLVGQLAQAPGMSRERAEAVMRDICVQISQQDSTRVLTVEQAEELIVRLEAVAPPAGKSPQHPPLSKGGRGDYKKQPSREARGIQNPDALITKEEQDMIALLFKDLGWTSPAQQIGVYKRQIKSPLPPITRGQGLNIIEFLKAVWLRQNKNKVASAPAMVEELWNPPSIPPLSKGGKGGLTRWEREFLADVRAKIQSGKKLTPTIIIKLTEIYEKRIGK